MILNLARNHTEYWKTFYRGGSFPNGYTVGFEWFATWKPSRRCRWPIGWNRGSKAELSGWKVTR